MELQIINENAGFSGLNRMVILGRGYNSDALEFRFECDDDQAEETDREITVNLVELKRTLSAVQDLQTYGSVTIQTDSYTSYITGSKLNIRYVEYDKIFILEINYEFELHFDADKLFTILEALDY